MSRFLQELNEGRVLLCDGAMGTLLMERGLRPGECPEALNLERPQVLEETAAAYRKAGADIVETNTFGGSPLKLAGWGLESRAAEINEAAVRAARRGAEGAFVAGSCGPTGKILKPYGDTDPAAVGESFRIQIEGLVRGGADVICVETMIDLAEARLAVRAAREISPETPVIATMTFTRTPRGWFTVMGVGIEQAAGELQEAGADVVGSNCGSGIEAMVEIAREFRRHSEVPVMIQANAGVPKLRDGEAVYEETPEFAAARIQDLVECGVAVIGGCCGTTPEHIRAFRRALEATGR